MKDLKYTILINKASSQFEERGFECILAVVLVLGTLVLSLFVPVAGVVISLIIAPFLCLGIKKYLLSVAKDSVLPIETVYGSYKLLVKAFCLKVAYTLISILWGIVFIIPGIVSALNYSMASFIMAENENISALECMNQSKKLVSGFRAQIFIIYLSYFFVSIATMCIFSAVTVAMRTFLNVELWIPIVAMVVGYLFVLIIFIIPYFELVFANVYLELKNKEKKSVAKQTTSAKRVQKTASEMQ